MLAPQEVVAAQVLAVEAVQCQSELAYLSRQFPAPRARGACRCAATRCHRNSNSSVLPLLAPESELPSLEAPAASPLGEVAKAAPQSEVQAAGEAVAVAAVPAEAAVRYQAEIGVSITAMLCAAGA